MQPGPDKQVRVLVMRSPCMFLDVHFCNRTLVKCKAEAAAEEI